MTKKEFIKVWQSACSCDQGTESSLTKEKEFEMAFNALCKVIQERLKTYETVPLPGIGKFHLVRRAARSGRNPRTGDLVPIPERNNVVFRPSKMLKEAINQYI